MTAFVLDNSVTMRWCFENTSTPYAEDVLEQLLVGQQAHVPVLWLYEVVSQTVNGNSDSLTDLYIGTGKIGQRPLSSACYSWPEVLRLAAIELWRCGEAEGARVTLKAAGGPSVRAFLRKRFGVVTGAREYWHRENWTPDRADLQEFLGALRDAKRP